MSLRRATYPVKGTTPGMKLVPWGCVGAGASDPTADSDFTGVTVTRLAAVGKYRVTIDGTGTLLALKHLGAPGVMDASDAASPLHATYQEVSLSGRYVDVYLTDLTGAPALSDLAVGDQLQGLLLVIESP